MQAGKLKHRITIQQRNSGRDAAGQPVLTWSDIAQNISASIIHQTGLQVLKAGAEVSIVKSSIRVRYITGITAGMRIVHGSTIYDIKAVLPDLEKKQHVDFICESGANDG